MTFDAQLCDNIFNTLGRDHTLRHAYRNYLWRRVRGLVDQSSSDDAATMGADICSLMQDSTRYSRTWRTPWRRTLN